MKLTLHAKRYGNRQRGFTLMELMTVTALIGVIASVAMPVYRDYLIQARVSEGVLLLGELRTRIATGFSRTGALSTEIPGSPTPNGILYGGPFYTYQTMFGAPHDMWEQIEYQPKGPNRVIALRAYRKPEWDNSDIGIHLQVKLLADNTLAFRCTVNNTITRMQFVPASCRDGSVDDWTSW